MLNYFDYLSIFVNAGENLVMADDVVKPSNLLVTPIKNEKFEKTLFDVNISQQL